MDFLGRFVRRYHPGSRTALLERMFRLWVLAAIEWAVLCAERRSDDLAGAIDQLAHLRMNERPLLEEMLAICEE